jgi:hypothetical protein
VASLLGIRTSPGVATAYSSCHASASV